MTAATRGADGHDQLGFAVSGRSGLSVTAHQQIARRAQDAGYSHVLATEAVGDPLALAMAMAAATDTITVGTSILNLRLRHPAVLAMQVAVAAELAPERLWLGLGLGTTSQAGEVLGLPTGPPLTTVREFVAVLRAALVGPVAHDGSVYRADGLELTRTLSVPVPVHVAGLQEGMLTTAGEVGDGVVLHLSSPEGAGAAAATARRAASKAGRDPGELRVACMVPVCVHDDSEVALAGARDTVLRYARHPAARQVFASSGHADQVVAVGDLLAAGETSRARDAVDPVLASSFVAHGPPERCRAQLDRYREHGVDLPIAFPMPAADASWQEALDAALDALAPV